MQDAETMLSLVGDIYDAALDPALWADVLPGVRDFVGGSAAAIFAKDTSVKSLNVYHDCGGSDPHYQHLYRDQYAKLDPLTTGHVLAEIGRPICTADIMPPDDFTKTRVYQEWVRPQGFVDMGAAVLDRSATGAVLFGIFRDKRHGLVDDDTRWRMRQIVPHIRRAMAIGRSIDLKTAEASSLADTLDGISAGMFLVDKSGRIVHVNASGRAMLDERSVLRASGGRLAANEANATLALNEVLAVAARGDAAVGVKGVSVPLAARDGDPHVAHVLPLSCGERRRAGSGYQAVAALFVHKAALGAPSLPETIASHYRLTPTELRVLLAVVEVGGVPEVAELLGIGQATVKTHLHRLFAKTETTRQAELVKLVAGFTNPLVNGAMCRG
jgi:DNA-binding CsgD family transcriptional regulator/PAS domain-containing protein